MTFNSCFQSPYITLCHQLHNAFLSLSCNRLAWSWQSPYLTHRTFHSLDHHAITNLPALNWANYHLDNHGGTHTVLQNWRCYGLALDDNQYCAPPTTSNPRDNFSHSSWSVIRQVQQRQITSIINSNYQEIIGWKWQSNHHHPIGRRKTYRGKIFARRRH